MQLEFKVDEQTLSLTSRQQVVADSLNYLTCKFNFSSEWRNIVKTAVFIANTEAVYTAVLDKNNECEVPWEVIEFPSFKVSVWGGNRITTNMIVVNVTASGYFEGDTSTEPSPDVYTQIMELIGKQNEEIHEIGQSTALYVEGNSITVNDSADMSLRGLQVFGKSTVSGDKLTHIAPEGEMEAYVRSKNLFDVDKFVEIIKANDNTAEEVEVDGRRCIKTWSSILYRKDFDEVFRFDPNKVYTWSMSLRCVGDSGDAIYLGFLYGDEQFNTASLLTVPQGMSTSNRYAKALGRDYTDFGVVRFTSSSKLPLVGIAFVYAIRSEWLIDLDSIQIEEGATATDYVPYEGQTLSVNLPDALRGVPVSEDGDYVDENGQHWICDEVDLVCHELTQRVGYIAEYNGETITTPYLSSTGELSTGAEVVYVLKESIKTPLTTEHLSSLDILSAYEPTTHVLNSENARMEMYYSSIASLPKVLYGHQSNPVLDHPDGSVTKHKLANDVISWITGLVRGATDFTGTLNPPSMMDSYIFPNDKGNLQIYRVEEDVGSSGGGILLVTGTTDYEFNTLTNIAQTYITCFGEVKTRKAESWGVTTGEVAVWSDWKSVYTTADDTATLSNRVETMAQEVSENTLKINNILATNEAEYKTVESDKLILRSSTEGSTKKFALTVDDSGVISVSEIELSPEIEFE